jgi:hypothetical protein
MIRGFLDGLIINRQHLLQIDRGPFHPNSLVSPSCKFQQRYSVTAAFRRENSEYSDESVFKATVGNQIYCFLVLSLDFRGQLIIELGCSRHSDIFYLL